MAQFYRREGDEIQVNEKTSGAQVGPAMTALSSGGFIATWVDRGANGGIKAQLFNANGQRFGGELTVNSTAAALMTPDVTALASGGFAISWTSTTGDGSGQSIKAQIFDGTGAKIGGEFLVNTQAQNDQYSPAITSLSSGGFVVSWTDFSQTEGGGSGTLAVRAQILGATGNKVGGEFLVNTNIGSNQRLPDLTSLASGGFVATWQDDSGIGGDVSGQAVKGQIFDAAGNKIGSEFLVNTVTSGSQAGPAVMSLASGGFVVAWYDESAIGGDTSRSGIKAQIFDGNGNKLGTEFRVNTTTANWQLEPDIARLPDGGFIVTWTDSLFDATSQGGLAVRAQIFDAAGNKVGDEFLVSSAESGTYYGPATTVLASGAIVVGWTEQSQHDADPDLSGISAQIFVPNNIAPTDIALSENSVSETAVENLPVATLSATGSSNSAFAYTILSDSTGGAFRIDGDKLIVTDNARLDFETAPNAQLTIRATDANGQSYDEAFTLAVRDAAIEVRLSAGAEHVVNSVKNEDQVDPAVAALSSGGFVATWTDESSNFVKAQLLDANGNRIGAEFTVSPQNEARQTEAAVTGLASGGFVVSWAESASARAGGDSDRSSVRAQVFDGAGVPVGGTFLVNTTSADDQRSSTITALVSGGFVVSWVDWSGQAGSVNRPDIKGQIFDAAGNRVGGEFLVNTGTDKGEMLPDIAALPSGGFIVTWNDFTQQGGSKFIEAQLFDASGNRVGSELVVNTTTLSSRSSPTVTALTSGNIVVSWSDNSRTGGDTDGSSIRAQILDSAGNKIGGEFLVNTLVSGGQGSPEIAALPNGGFIVSWVGGSGNGTDDSGGDIRAQVFDAAGNKAGDEFLVNRTTFGSQGSPALAVSATGSILAAWAGPLDYYLDPTRSDIRARVLSFANDSFNGTGGDDVLTGTPGGDAISGGAGNDELRGGGGSDLIAGGTGNDRLFGDSGEDQVSGDDGDDYIDGGSGRDQLFGGAGRDYMIGGAEGDVMLGGADGDIMFGGSGEDDLRGEAGDDYLDGGSERDILSGDAGRDDLHGGAGNDSLGGGADNDLLFGDDGDDDLRGGDGDDYAVGGSGRDSIQGDAGADTLYGGGDTDVIMGGGGEDFIFGEDGDDYAEGGADRDVLFGGSGRDTLIGGLGSDSLLGGTEGDSLFGEDGDDEIRGGDGDDYAVGGSGGDYLLGDAGADTLYGGGATDVMIGGDGEDFIFGEDGDDYAEGGADRDVLFGGSGRDTLNGGLGNDSVVGGADGDLLFGDSGSDRLEGESGDDYLDGGTGDDTLLGGTGADVLVGGEGADRFTFAAVADSGFGSAPDFIADFNRGAGDAIDLSQIDANAGTGGNDAFSLIGSAAFSGTAGQLRYDIVDGRAHVFGDVNGDGAADLFFVVNVNTIQAQDFVL